MMLHEIFVEWWLVFVIAGLPALIWAILDQEEKEKKLKEPKQP